MRGNPFLDWMLMGLCFTSAITIIIIALTLMFKDGAEQVLRRFRILLPIKRVGFILSVNIFLYLWFIWPSVNLVI
jgi:hypothetical protein